MPNAEVLPRQRLPRKQKGKKWGKAVIDNLENYVYSDNYNGRASRAKKQVNYDLFNGRINQSDFEYVTNPFGFKDDEFPANLQHYDIISPKLNLLMGEEMKRPFNFRVKTENPDAISAIEKKQVDMMKQMLMGMYQQEAGQEPEEEVQTPEEVQKYINYEYQDIREKTGQNTLNYLIKEQFLEEKFHRGFKDALIAGEECYWVGEINGEPVVRNVNTVDLTIILDPDSEYIEDSQAITEERWLTTSTVLDQFYKSLTPSEIDSIEKDNGRSSSGDGKHVNYPYSDFTIRGPEQYYRDNRYYRSHDTDGTIRVVSCEWKSMRKVGFINFFNPESGEMEEDIVDEIFEVPEEAQKNSEEKYEWADENEFPITLEWEWISEYWEGTKIGDDIYVNIRPKAKQRRSMDNPSICKSGYVGYIYNSRNSEAISLIDRMKPYQYFYNIMMYRLELAIAKSKGKVALMDIAQIPSAEGWDVDKWLYYMESMGLMFINSHEEGKRGQQSTFNQFQSIDLTLGDYIQQTVNILDKLKEEVGELSGVSKQRQGQIATSELVGNTERAVTQSSHITEFWFYYHNEVKRRVLEALIDVAKMAWKNGKKINYIMDDMARVFFNIDGDEFDSTEYGVFVSNTTKDEHILQQLRSLSQVALQSEKASLFDVAKMMQSNSIAGLTRDLEQVEEKSHMRQLETIEKQNETAKQIEQSRVQDEQDKRNREDERNLLDNQTRIQVAEISAGAKLQGDAMKIAASEGQGEGDNQGLDQAKFGLDTRKHDDTIRLKQDELNEKKRMNSAQLGLKKEEVSIKRKQANKPTSVSK